MIRLKIILIIIPHDNGVNVFGVTLFIYLVLIEDNILEYISAKISKRESWQVKMGIPILLL